MSDEREKFPSEMAERFQVRMPAGLRDRIKLQADRNGRSMNAEIIQALEQFFPPEPTTEELLDRIHEAIDRAERAHSVPYRTSLIDALNQFADRLSTGIDFDHFMSTTKRDDDTGHGLSTERRRRFRNAGRYGIDTEDLQRELDHGLLRFFSPEDVDTALGWFEFEDPERALRTLRLDVVKFREPKEAHRVIEAKLREMHQEMNALPQFPDDIRLEDE